MNDSSNTEINMTHQTLVFCVFEQAKDEYHKYGACAIEQLTFRDIFFITNIFL